MIDIEVEMERQTTATQRTFCSWGMDYGLRYSCWNSGHTLWSDPVRLQWVQPQGRNQGGGEVGTWHTLKNMFTSSSPIRFQHTRKVSKVEVAPSPKQWDPHSKMANHWKTTRQPNLFLRTFLPVTVTSNQADASKTSACDEILQLFSVVPAPTVHEQCRSVCGEIYKFQFSWTPEVGQSLMKIKQVAPSLLPVTRDRRTLRAHILTRLLKSGLNEFICAYFCLNAFCGLVNTFCFLYSSNSWQTTFLSRLDHQVFSTFCCRCLLTLADIGKFPLVENNWKPLLCPLFLLLLVWLHWGNKRFCIQTLLKVDFNLWWCVFIQIQMRFFSQATHYKNIHVRQADIFFSAYVRIIKV